MIKDTRSNFVSASVEYLKDNLVPAGNINNIPSFYSYPEKSIKINYSLKYFLELGEITSVTNQITYVGYNRGNSLSDFARPCNITGVNVGDIVYIEGKEYFSCTISATSFPEYAKPEFDEQVIYENQTKIGGYYLDGSVYIDDVNNAGKLTKTRKTVLVSDLNTDVNKYEVTPKSQFGTTTSKYTLSITPNNYRYIIDNGGNADLYVDIEIVEIE